MDPSTACVDCEIALQMARQGLSRGSDTEESEREDPAAGDEGTTARIKDATFQGTTLRWTSLDRDDFVLARIL